VSKRALGAAIRLENVSKIFMLRHERSRSFKELALSLPDRSADRGPEEFWALRDVSLEVEAGTTVGIIGANGAGKSTLLKIVSRILAPTDGRVEVDGRVSALLELGAGFHPDLTGRENIYLNGSIMGLSRAEIRRKFHQIVAFSELERFIDVPVKHYSSGMHVRLGFSVAVHTDPEVVLIDEVMAVGDQNFQHKCVERILDMQRGGVTICYVSHGLGSVRQLCSQALWLKQGRVAEAGSVDDTISAYLRYLAEEEEARLGAARSGDGEGADDGASGRRWGTRHVEITDVAFLDGAGREQSIFLVGAPWTVRMRYRTRCRIERPVFGLAVYRKDGAHICGPNTYFAGLDIPYLDGEGEVYYRVKELPLMEGSYLLVVAAHNEPDTVMYDHHDRLYEFRVRQVGRGEKYGMVSVGGEWEWVAAAGRAAPRDRQEEPILSDASSR
jgi:ABC-type polysaccharide/polyol phosphate transport system ATPase subunit